MTHASRRLSLLALLCCASSAYADLMPDTPGGKNPDIVVFGLAFESKTSVATHKYPLSLSAAVPVSLKLGTGDRVQTAGGPALCMYKMTVDAINAGPGNMSASWMDFPVATTVTYPDGSSGKADGAFNCPGPGATAGGGCSVSEDVVLVEGTTQVVWSLNDGGKYAEYSTDNNKYQVDLQVPPGCDSSSTAAKLTGPGKQSLGSKGSAPLGSAAISTDAGLSAEAVAQSRESLSRALRSSRPGKTIVRPIPRR